MTRFVTSGRLAAIVSFIVGLSITSMALAGDITSYANDKWLTFKFFGTGSFVVRCLKLDPSDIGCQVTGNAVAADDPPWTFTAGPGGATVTITDAFVTGDEFALYDHGVFVGVTSPVEGNTVCGGDPDVCLASGEASNGSFALAEGFHSLTIQMFESPLGLGAAYFRVDGDVLNTPEPPEPEDSDGDGIPDAEDACAHSILTPTVVANSCDSGVANTLWDDGCTIADVLAECGNGAGNHGMRVSCVNAYLNDLKKLGFLESNDKGNIGNCFAQDN